MSEASIHDLRIDRSGNEPQRSGRWVALLGLVVVGLIGWGLFAARGAAEIKVRTVLVEVQSSGSGLGTVLNATGYVTARRHATVSSKVSGKIVDILVEEGDAVTEGQVVARLDSVNVQAMLALSEAQWEASQAATDETGVLLTEATLNLDRLTRLAKEQIASASDLDEARARVDSLRARLHRLSAEIKVAERQVKMREQDLDDLEIRAPFSGVVISKDAQPGEVISPVSAGSGFTRTGICTLVDMASLEIEVDVNESFINRVRPRQKVIAVLDAYTDWKINANVIAIVPSADRQKATVKVRIGFEELDDRILPEMGIKVSFQQAAGKETSAGPERRIQIPSGCLFSEGGTQYVWVVSGRQVEKRAIRVLSTLGEQAGIEAGLRGGEILVADPPSELENGDVVEIDES